MNLLLCESADREGATAGKARVDVRDILLNKGYSDVVLFHNGRAKLIIMLEIIAGCLRTVAKAKKGDQVFFQYPYYSKFVHRIIFGLLSFGKRVKGYTVCVYADPRCGGYAKRRMDDGSGKECPAFRGKGVVLDRPRDLSQRKYAGSFPGGL